MPSISDRLKALGVTVGPREITPKPKTRYPSLDEVLQGHSSQNHFGETYRVDACYPSDYLHGNFALLASAPLDIISQWAGDPHIAQINPADIAYLDIETTGLSGGTGTYAFLIGAARFRNDQFELAQFFLRDPAEEPAQLAELESFLAPCQAVTTYNGKSFDIPLLNTRYATHSWRSPFKDLAHIDLLHLSRRLWRDRLQSRTLGNIEVHVLGAQRSEDDLPGWMAPQLYFDYLRSGDPGLLKGVFYHNAIDVISLAALLNHIADLLTNPLEKELAGVDIFALARLYEDLGRTAQAVSLYLHGLEITQGSDDLTPVAAYRKALMRLARIYKRMPDYDQAIALWEQAAEHGELDAFIELAKCFEHRKKDFTQALQWTNKARALVNTIGITHYERQSWEAELQHRVKRLERKLTRQLSA